MKDFMVDPSIVARMANDTGAVAGDLDVSEAADTAACGSSAVTAALDMFSENYSSALKKTRVGLSQNATDALASANDYSALDQLYAATFRAFESEVG